MRELNHGAQTSRVLHSLVDWTFAVRLEIEALL